MGEKKPGNHYVFQQFLWTTLGEVGLGGGHTMGMSNVLRILNQQAPGGEGGNSQRHLIIGMLRGGFSVLLPNGLRRPG